MGRLLCDSPVEAGPDGSLIAPVEIVGLPAEIFALGRCWQRKIEFHMTVMGAALIEAAGVDRDAVARVVAGRRVGPLSSTRELRRVRHPDNPDLETIVVMVECPALRQLYEELTGALGADLAPPPAHVTLYSTDPEQGIGLNDEAQLRERALELRAEEQDELLRAIDFDAVFGAET